MSAVLVSRVVAVVISISVCLSIHADEHSSVLPHDPLVASEVVDELESVLFSDEPDAEVAVERLSQMPPIQMEQWYLDLIRLSAHPPFQGKHRERGLMLIQFLLRELSSRMIDEYEIRMLIPYIEEPDPAIAREITVRLKEVTLENRVRNYKPFVDAVKFSEPGESNLIAYFMFTVDPHAAVLALLANTGTASTHAIYAPDVEKVRDAVWSISFPTDSAAHERVVHLLTPMQNDGNLWLRAYVAYLLGEYRSIRSNELVQRAKMDPHPVVQKIVSRWP